MDYSKNLEALNHGIELDMKLICADLREQALISGAFCQDYELFKIIYRFIERRLKRTNSTSYLILFTLTDKNCNFLSLNEREMQMATLHKVIQNALRMGDVFTQYSGCQFLIMVPDAAEQSVNMIAARIHDMFFLENRRSKNTTLLHHSCPMQPATHL
ncbi:MAG: hypothetical protein RRZ73_01120 [Oscillospiraceae bacterium]